MPAISTDIPQSGESRAVQMGAYGPSCPLCEDPATAVVYRRAAAPVFVNRVYPTAAEARAAIRGDIELRWCGTCQLLFNGLYDAKLVRFDGGYENEQALSPSYSAHLDANLDRVLRLLGGSPARVIEIGCGQGTFLRRLGERAELSLDFVGYDPALARVSGDNSVHEQPGSSNLALHPRYYDAADSASSDPALFVLRSVLEYFTDPVGFLASLGPGDRKTLCIESASAEAIVRNQSVNDIYYEYFALYSAVAMHQLFARSGWGSATSEETFGGQYLWTESAAEAGRAASISVSDVQRLGEAATAQPIEWAVKTAKISGPVAVWGASGKGTNFTSMVDPGRQSIDCLIDINPLKQGSFAPCTAHPIVSPKQAVARGARAVHVINPNYRAEVAEMLGRLDPAIAIID